MEIRNLMEDKVIQIINDICDEEEENQRKGYCTSNQCRTDAACFVLNRIPQRYVSSGRGVAYLETDFNANTQLQVDIVALVHEGLRRVSEIQRNFYSQRIPDSTELPDTKAAFIFPTIKGRLIHGLSFDPIKDVSIRILQDGQLLEMIDGRWPNPYAIVGNIPGTYLFWPKPLPSQTIGEEKTFSFILEVDDTRYEAFRHFFSLTLHSVGLHHSRDTVPDYTISDLFLLPRGNGDNDMQLNPGDPDSDEA